ncbi:MAG: tripartite tricarboxylate transporter family receptor [Hyphomicrobiales bacterium]|nr:tripartite tricarboxylate transporter family receptor [Hyphomicrobiales bacterium]
MKRILPALAAASAAQALLAAGAQAQPAEAFYRSTPLTIVVGYTPGGAYDVYARTVGRHIGDQLPGKPRVIVQNMPGAGSLKSANYIYALAPRDGSQIAAFARGVPAQPLLDAQGVQYDATKLNWIGSPSSEVSVVFSWATTSFKTFEDLRQREMSVAASGSGADSAINAQALNGILGTKLKIVVGYPGNAEMLLAVERGETEGNAGTSWSFISSAKRDWLTQNKINLLAQLGLKKHPDLAHVPLVLDLAKTPEDRKALELVVSRQAMAYPLAAPPDIPGDRLKALRDAFDAMVKAPAFIEDVKRQQLEVDATSGVEMTEFIKALYATPPAVIERARAAVQGK